MNLKAKIMDEAAISRSIARITHEIIEKNRGANGICLVGIKSRGIPLANRLCENIKKFEGVDVPVGYIDITHYRDDRANPSSAPSTVGCEIPCDVKEYKIIIVDDVLYTGRTVRAAIDSIFRLGRPKAIQLAVLIDRGHRELPIRPDFVGKNIPTAKTELVSVRLSETDGENGVCLYDM